MDNLAFLMLLLFTIRDQFLHRCMIILMPLGLSLIIDQFIWMFDWADHLVWIIRYNIVKKKSLDAFLQVYRSYGHSSFFSLVYEKFLPFLCFIFKMYIWFRLLHFCSTRWAIIHDRVILTWCICVTGAYSLSNESTGVFQPVSPFKNTPVPFLNDMVSKSLSYKSFCSLI